MAKKAKAQQRRPAQQQRRSAQQQRRPAQQQRRPAQQQRRPAQQQRRPAQQSDYDNTNRGVLFRNNRKNSEKHPDYTGQINIEGVEYWLAGWVQKPRGGGDKFIVTRVTAKDADYDSDIDGDDYGETETVDDLPF